MLPNTGPSTSRSHGTVKNREIFPDMLPKSSNRAPGSSPERPFSARLPRIAVQYRPFFPNPLPKPLRIPAADGKRRRGNARPGRARQRKARLAAKRQRKGAARQQAAPASPRGTRKERDPRPSAPRGCGSPVCKGVRGGRAAPARGARGWGGRGRGRPLPSGNPSRT